MRCVLKVYFYTLGCRVNQYETDAVREVFKEHGFEICQSAEEADVCVVNTCTVTSEADRKSRQQLRRMARLRPDAIICAMGCSTQMSEGQIDADVICGTRDKHVLIEKLEEFIKSGKVPEHKGEYDKSKLFGQEGYAEFGTVLSPENTRAFIKVQDGCNHFCTYCIIPFARGRVVSRDARSVVDEVEDLASRGITEVCITGIHLCSYGKDKGGSIMDLYDLIHRVCAIDGILRVSLGSLEPISLTDEFLESLASEKKLSPHFHLSLQSGSDTVLKRMRRDYTAAEFLGRAEKIRELFPDASLTTDIICGFPEETDEEFDETVKFVKTVNFSKVHVFPYSLRKGTIAARMPQVPGQIAKKRALELIELSNEQEVLFAKQFDGRECEMLIETFVKEDDKIVFEGYTAEYVYARSVAGDIEDPQSYIGKLLKGTAKAGSGTVLEIICD